ncbi:MAG: Cna B-type domain-containing protein [Lachnospiraceae bacterium]
MITDELPATETFDSFDKYAWWYQNDKWATAAKSLDGEMPFNSGNRSFKIEGRKITITIPASDLNHVQPDGTVVPVCGEIDFYTKTTAAAGSRVDNTASVTYYDDTTTTQPVNTTASGYAIVHNQGGTITGVPQGEIEIHKQVKGTTEPVAGVTFHIQKITSETDTTPDSSWTAIDVTTDTDGVAKTAEGACPDGWYLITEISGPDWIVIPSNSAIKVQMGGSTGVRQTVEDEVKTTNITATKKWVQADGQTPDTGEHPTIYFQLYSSVNNETPAVVEDAETKTITTETGQSESTVTWTGLPQYDNSGNEYTYSVKEVDAQGYDAAPAGYFKTEDGLTVTNTKIPTSVTVEKMWDAEDSDRPDSVTVNLLADGEEALDSNGNPISVVLAPQNGWKTIISNLPKYNAEGIEINYTVQEDVPDGYTADVSGEKGIDGTFNYTVTNKPITGEREVPASLTLKKTDNNGKALDGAVFTLYDGDKEVKTYKAGTAAISSDDLLDALGDADSKTFTLKETKAPDGYQAGTKEYTITLTKETEQKWEGEGADRKYMTVTTYTLTSSDAKDGTITVANTPVEKTKVVKNTPKNGSIIKTGDTSNLVLWTVLLICSAGAIVTVLVRRRKRSR